MNIRDVKQGTLFIAPLGARNKRENIFKEIASLHPGNDFSGVLYLAPNAFAVSTVKRQFFSFYKKERNKSAYVPFQAFTLKQLAANYFENTPLPPLDRGELIPSEFSMISSRMRTLILSEILKDKNIGYASLLSDLFRKIRHYVLDKDLSRIKEDIRQLIFEEKTRDRAIKAIETLQSYESFLKEKNVIDTEDVLRNVGAGQCACPGQTHWFAPTIVIDGFFDPTPLELRMINALVENADRTVILAEENTELLRHFLLRKEGMTVKKLERSVHREAIGYFPYNSIEEEVEGIAKNIGKLIIEGVKPWEITICFPSLSQYLPMLRRIFGKYRIPASIGEYGLSATKPVALLEEMIACIENDYPRNEFLSILTSPCLTLIDDAVKKRAVTLSYRAGIIKGKESWLSIEGTIKSANGDLSEDDKERIGAFQNGVKQVINLLESIKNPPLPPSPLERGAGVRNRGESSLIHFINALESALDKLGFFDYLKNPIDIPPFPPLERGAGVCNRGEQISHAITNLFTELRQFTQLYGASLQAGDAGFYLRYLIKGLTASNETIDGVKVLPYELAAAIEPKALFFGGVIEGSFPSRPGIDPVLPEKVKKSLGIPHLEYYLERQNEYFKRLLNVPAFDPYISCPTADGDKIFLPSPFLDWEKMVYPAELNIFTEEDALVRDGTASDLINETGAETYFDAKAVGMLRGRIGAMVKRYFRVTDIDYYRKCPFRFYLEKILHLEMETPPRFEVEYRQWGNLAHKTMEHLFKDKEWELEEFEKRLFKALEKALKDFPIGEFWADVTREIFRNLLPLLKKQEAEIRIKGFTPWLVEEKIDAEIEGVKFRGKIDRIDKKIGVKESRSQGVEGESLGHSNPRTLEPSSIILLDYKTGDVDRKSLQLPLYARMWQGGHPEQAEEAGYYSLKEGKVTWYPPKKKSMEEFIREAVNEAVALIDQMKKGMFPAEPSGNECRNCRHGALCGKG